MKRHIFNNENGSWDICQGCHLSWIEIKLQLSKERENIFMDMDKDDCLIRQKKQQLKAFW